jgi:hypothetical protein
MNTQKLFFSAKACLLSLKRTLEDLQKKGLFPYNPGPLLRRSVMIILMALFLCNIGELLFSFGILTKVVFVNLTVILELAAICSIIVEGIIVGDAPTVVILPPSLNVCHV